MYRIDLREERAGRGRVEKGQQQPFTGEVMTELERWQRGQRGVIEDINTAMKVSYFPNLRSW